jgi:hypothetical protein
MMARLVTWVFRLAVLWGAQRLIRWFSENYGEDRARTRKNDAAGADEPRE